MKAKFSLAIVAALVIFGLTSCTLNTLSGTSWRLDVLGTGTGVDFNTESTGATTAGVVGVWGDVLQFTYVFNSTSQSGTITYDGTTTTSDFTIEGSNLTMDGVTYKKQ